MGTELMALFLFGAFVILLIWTRSRKHYHHFPPGPLAFPVLGHLPLLGSEAHKTLIKWKKTYGPIIGIAFGSYKAVAIHDADLIREALNHSSFAGRPKLNFLLARAEGLLKGVVANEGRHWMEQRKFAIRSLRDLGPRTQTMEGKIQEEIERLLEIFKAASGKPVQIHNVFNFAVSNVLWKIMFHDSLDPNDSETREALYQLTQAFEKCGWFSAIASFVPWLAKIAPTLSGYRDMVEGLMFGNKFIQKHIKLHQEGYLEGQPRGFADCYEDEIRKTKDPHSSFHRAKDQMFIAVYDLIAAGGETTSTVLSWMCLYLVRYPEVQSKLQAEIDDVIGTERVPLLSDRSQMPYAEAVIHEILRYSTITPFSVLHSTIEDVEFHGFLIPKDTMILPNIYSVHFDRKIWGDPESFRPERFLDGSGKFKGNPNLLAFSSGKRVCLGETVARDKLFLFLTHLFQTFIARPAGKMPSLEQHVGFTVSPLPFEVVWEERRPES